MLRTSGQDRRDSVILMIITSTQCSCRSELAVVAVVALVVAIVRVELGIVRVGFAVVFVVGGGGVGVLLFNRDTVVLGIINYDNCTFPVQRPGRTGVRPWDVKCMKLSGMHAGPWAVLWSGGREGGKSYCRCKVRVGRQNLQSGR
jgi:hypothetical protein